VKKAIELIRVSTIQQAGDDRFSIPAQRTINRKTAAANGLTIAKTIEISDVGGSDVLSSPEIQALIKTIQDPEIHAVVAREFSRLMRPENLGDFYLLQAFADSKTLLVLPDGPIDFSTKGGKIIGGIRALFAGYEKTELLEKSQGAREEMRRLGKCPSAPMTWPTAVAYDKVKGWFYLPEITSVRKCFELFLSGVSNYNEIERATGISKWNVRGILSNPIYTGWRVYDKKRDPSREARYAQVDGRQSDRRKMARTQEDVIRVKVIDDPIVSDADFARVQEMLAAKVSRHLRARHSTDSRFVYHGFLACSSCGKPEYTKSFTSQKSGLVSDYYMCSAKGSYLSNKRNPVPFEERCSSAYMRRERIETHLDGIFAARLTDRGFLRELVDEFDVRAKGKGSEKKIARLQTQLSKLEEKRQRILDGYFEGMISRDDRESRLTIVDRDRGLVAGALDDEVPAHPGISVEQLVALFRPLFTWKTLHVESKRRILFSLVPQIRVANYVVAGMSLLVPALVGDETEGLRKPPSNVAGLPHSRETFGYYENRRRTAPLIAETPSRVYIPLNL
jgi:DNA invertase Pin-like site-specific DNA recombinase